MCSATVLRWMTYFFLFSGCGWIGRRDIHSPGLWPQRRGGAKSVARTRKSSRSHDINRWGKCNRNSLKYMYRQGKTQLNFERVLFNCDMIMFHFYLHTGKHETHYVKDKEFPLTQLWIWYTNVYMATVSPRIWCPHLFSLLNKGLLLVAHSTKKAGSGHKSRLPFLGACISYSHGSQPKTSLSFRRRLADVYLSEP